MTKNKIAYALIAGILAVGITSASFAVAEPAMTEDAASKTGTAHVFKIRMMDSVPEIEGTIPAEDWFVDGAKIGLPEAASMAESSTGGTAVAGHLGVHSGYMTYTFVVTSDDQMRTVIVDAGNGEVLYTSEPRETSEKMILHTSKHGMMSGKMIASGNSSVHIFKCTDTEETCTVSKVLRTSESGDASEMKIMRASESGESSSRMMIASGNPDAQFFRCTEDGCNAINKGELAFYKQE